jgi:hypothetical protein
MKQFVPVTDEMLFDAADFAGALVPYQFGISCARQLRDDPLPGVDVAARASAVSAPPLEYRRV